ncbi:MAG: hypothetical protein KAH32_05220, partial [Chlamydiia bacterium]|nr:hypothetical protein [Chlamydiia bacterium]
MSQFKRSAIKVIAKSVLLLAIVSCNNDSTQEKKADQKVEVKRFFSDDSFWNQPIAKDAKIDRQSDYWIGLLDRDPSGENIGLNVDSHTIPIYEVDSKNTPFQKVEQTPDHETIPTHFAHHKDLDKAGVPIPENMVPAAGSDGHVALIDWEENKVWDMFLVTKLDNGSWSSATGMVYDLDGTGVFNKSEFDIKPGKSIHGFGPGVAAGVPIIAGVIRYDEVMRGEIRHKLA